MKTPVTAILSFTLLCGLTLAAESPYTATLDQMRKQHEHDLAAAAAPINSRYQLALQDLERKATQANDLDAALKIKKAMDEIAIAAQHVADSPVVGVWEVRVMVGGWHNDIEFKSDGTLTAGWDGLTGTWEENDRELTFTLVKNGQLQQTDTFKLPIKGGKLLGADNSGSKKILTKKTM